MTYCPKKKPLKSPIMAFNSIRASAVGRHDDRAVPCPASQAHDGNLTAHHNTPNLRLSRPLLTTDTGSPHMAATAMASPASPRLPSPPPIAEDQLSPVPASPEQQKFFSNLDHAAARRIRPGTKAEDMAEGPPLVELSEVRARNGT